MAKNLLSASVNGISQVLNVRMWTLDAIEHIQISCVDCRLGDKPFSEPIKALVL